MNLPELSEVRHINFSKDALIYALKSYLSASKQALPSGLIQGCEVATTPDISVTLVILNDLTGLVERAVIPAETIGAAMIIYCRMVGVPLPRNAEKSLVASGDNLVLTVHVRAKQTKLFEIRS